MRLVFAGTPAVAVPSLTALAQRFELATVITRDDAPQGRRRVLTPSPVADAATERGLSIIKANRLEGTVTRQVHELRPDLGVIVAYGGVVRDPLLSAPRLGWVNLHFSLLPRWRGAAPVQRAVIAGDTETGAVVFRLEAGLDTGDVFAELRRPIPVDTTAGDLLGMLAVEGAGLLADTVAAIAEGTAVATPQEGEAVLAPKLTIDDARLDLTCPMGEVYSRLRGVTPEPGAWALLNGERFKILAARPGSGPALAPGAVAGVDSRVEVGTGTTTLELVGVQPAGRRAMAAADWWRGAGGVVVLS